MSHDPLAGFRRSDVGKIIVRARDGKRFRIEEVSEHEDFTLALCEIGNEAHCPRVKCATARRWITGR